MIARGEGAAGTSVPARPVESMGEIAARVAMQAGAARRLATDGYLVVNDFARDETLASLLEEAKAGLLTAARPAQRTRSGRVPTAIHESDTVRRLFGIHTLPAGRALLGLPALIDLARCVLGENVDCFLSMYRERSEGDVGESWHQDGFWYPSTSGAHLLVMLSLTDTRPSGGGIRVVPGSHRDGLRPHSPDDRPGAGGGRMRTSEPAAEAVVEVDLKAGDLFALDYALVHCAGAGIVSSECRDVLFCFTEPGSRIQADAILGIYDRRPWIRHGRHAETYAAVGDLRQADALSRPLLATEESER